MTILTTVQEGTISDKCQKQIRDFLTAHDGKLIAITLTRKYRPKSDQQRGYYWGVMLPAIYNGAQGTEYEYDDLMQIHESMKTQFLTIVPMKSDGTFMTEKVLSTEDLNRREVEEYYEQIRRLWAMRGIDIPLPNEKERVFLELV